MILRQKISVDTSQAVSKLIKIFIGFGIAINLVKHVFYSDALDSTTEESNRQWTVKATKLLLELYKERKKNFRDPKTKKRNLWTEIVNEMDKNGYKNLTEDILDRKLRNLKKTFRTIKDNNRKSSTGRGRITWEYYDIFEEIFSDDRTINFGPTISSMDSDSAVASSIAVATSVASSIASPFASTSSASSSSMRLSASSVPARLSTRISPVRTPSPSSTRYVCHIPIWTSMPSVLTKIFMHSSDFFNSTDERDSFFDENITNFSCSSYSSSSVAAEHSFSESDSVIGFLPSSEYFSLSSQRQKRKSNSKETYDLRKKLLLIEKERVEMMAELKKSLNDNNKRIDDNNKIQQERNDLLKKLLEKL